jgi:hypothetical protein
MLRPLVWIPLLLCVAGPALGGVPVLFVSPLDDGANPGPPPVLPGSPSESLYLYLDAGASPTGVGTACEDGDGDELCQWEFVVQLSGAATVSNFVADPAQDIVWNSNTSTLAATGGKAVVGELGPVRLGELQIGVAGPGWTADVTAGNVVDAAFTTDSLTTGTIALPEPGFAIQWTGGLATLLGLSRRRGWQSKC